MLQCDICKKVISDDNIHMCIYMAFDKMHCSLKCRNHTIDKYKMTHLYKIENMNEEKYECFPFFFLY